MLCAAHLPDLSIMGYLVILLLFACALWYIKFRWDRREMYRMISEFKQAAAPPLIGHTFTLIGSPTDIFRKIVNLLAEYEQNVVIWFVNRPYVAIGKPEDMETTLQSQNCLDKNYLYEFTEEVVGTGLFSAPVHKWRRNRKIIMPAFNSRILENFVPIFASTSSICAHEILPKFVGKKGVDWYSVFTSVNLDTISQTAMGINTDAQRKDLPFANWLEKLMQLSALRIYNPFYHPDFIFFRMKVGKTFKECQKKLWGFTDQVVTEKREKFKQDLENNDFVSTFEDDNGPIKRKAFLDLLLHLDHKGMSFSNIELRDEVNTFFVGGTDTSAVTSCFFLTMMGMYQDIQDKVFEEIMDILGPDRTPTMEDLSKLKLLERCLKETLRLFPPAPFVIRDVTGGDIKISDGTIPKGASIFYPFIHLHRNPLYWERPLEFNPDRFLPDQVAKRHPYTFLPFSGGLRGCIGQKYSYMNLKTLQSTILRKFRVYCDYKTVEEIELDNFLVLRPLNGFKFYLEERK
ncbi:hypothetical protein HHI36_021593 [Cryptolaemus montrouzieri]|uniref:Cytochrome P450 n=1 Tax=Cryptolaemus montrouzieri TaxID=559131 RepID=A0ABD2MXP5_9CUCU